MNVCILMGSMKKNGNTEMLSRPFVEQLKSQGINVEYIWLSDKNLQPCKSCFVCQSTENIPGCSIKDDMENVYKAILNSDCIVFATPIYSWFCTTPMKIVMDRLFCMNKFYGNTKTHYGLLENKKCAIIATCGYEIEQGADLFEESLKRFSNHSHLDYLGMLAVRDINGICDFETEEVIQQAKEFAVHIYNACT
ncbi:flavodoxin family protein [Oceanirhabdus sp. W0125-5]|uniref:flavodoxin family protein n=1 Tax=Oceanirhabdus sp. W0125-5 TaxID=2999116 RepID=UPI0022F312BF|nr:flavodoxin family protein [Oceanirhabdus sp. W0125-5]WBW99167.1 flavodoxin family protein [Oceanirhabdus sp. W0125-5]